MKRLILFALLIACSFNSSFAQQHNKTLMRQYLLIFRFKSDFVPSSKEAVQANIKHWNEYMSDLGRNGKLVTGFRPTDAGRTITGLNKTTHEGRYVANNETISSFIVINAKSIDEASEIAAACPIFEFDGSVEVRPVMQTAN